MPKQMMDCVKDLKAQGKGDNAYAICSKATGWVRHGKDWENKKTGEVFHESFLEMFTEAFDKPYKWKLAKTDAAGSKYFYFTKDDGEMIGVELYRQESRGEHKTVLSFKTEKGELDLTGRGDAFRVFATVLDIVKKEKKQLKEYGDLIFSAHTSEPSRVKLYQTMSKKLQNLLGYKKLKVTKSAAVFYTLTDKD